MSSLFVGSEVKTSGAHSEWKENFTGHTVPIFGFSRFPF